MRFCGKQRGEAPLLATESHVCTCDITGVRAGESLIGISVSLTELDLIFFSKINFLGTVDVIISRSQNDSLLICELSCLNVLHALTDEVHQYIELASHPFTRDLH